MVPAVRRSTATIPVVMANSADPVALGYVDSLARPGGNITGLSNSEIDSTPKQMELLLKIAPSITRFGFVLDPDSPSYPLRLKIAQAAAVSLGHTLLPVQMRSVEDILDAFPARTNEGVGALLIQTNPFIFAQRRRIMELALMNRLPTISAQRDFVEIGGLMSYGESNADFLRRAAFYVDKIFKGAKPAELPVQQPTRFFLTINRKTAEALRLTIPLELLVLSDELID
jgi:putative tryptophan/tyrosine transport system substrate-binding protein